MRADLKRFGKFAFVERVFTLGAFYKNAFGFNVALFGVVLIFYFWFISSKPGHKT
jgi:hypothetical protein